MNRIQKKCVVASAGMHVLLAAIIFIGPAFSFEKKQTADYLELINFEPSIMTDGPTHGGSPKAAAAAPLPQPTPVQPPPQPVPKLPDPPQETRKTPEPETRPEPNADSFVESKKPKKPNISLVPVTRPHEKSATKPTTDTSAQERQLADAARRKAGEEALRMAANIREGTSSATSVDSDFGNGEGGPLAANYAAWVRSVFDSAWVAPEDTKSDTAVAKARVIIAIDGRVLSAEIISRSGDPQMDASVQRTLDRVPTVRKAFPEGSKDKQRSYIITFDLKVKRGTV